MRFLFYDITFLVVFGLFVILFLYKRRKNLKRDGILYLYHTQLGVKFIDYIGKKFKKTLKVLSYFVIVIGYALMIVMTYLLLWIVYIFLRFPNVVRQVKIPPIMPLVPYLPSIFKIDILPPFYFTYWIIAIAIIAISHEFSHGIFAKLHNIKVKSTGFGFLGPFLAAFVEPDEKQMAKKSIGSQLSVLSAGSFANVIMTIIFFVILYLFFISAFVPAGALFTTYSVSSINISNINSIGGISTEDLGKEGILDLIEDQEIEPELKVNFEGIYANLTEIEADGKTYFTTLRDLEFQLEEEGDSIIAFYNSPAIKAGLKGKIVGFDDVEIKNYEDLGREMAEHKPGDKVTIKTKFNDTILSYDLELAEHPEDEDKALIGIGFSVARRAGIGGFFYRIFSFFKDPSVGYEPKFDSSFIIFIYNLLWWIVIINISVALVNMLPVGIFDGGRVFFLTILAITKKEKTAKNFFVGITYFILFIFLLLMVSWFLSII